MSGLVAARIATALLLLAVVPQSFAEDVDIFFGEPSSVTVGAPNVLFILDNSANWSKASQKWPAPSATQGEAELLAISTVVAGLTKPLNVGVMMLTETGQYGSYVRFGIRPMLQGGAGSAVSTSNTALRSILSSISAKVNDPSEKVSQAHDGYANSMFETWRYITGGLSWAGMDAKGDYSGNNTAATAAKLGLASGFAYQSSANQARYVPPNGYSTCASTYIIYVGNNRNGTMPYTPGASDPATTTFDNASTFVNASDNARYPIVGVTPQESWASFLRVRPDLPVAQRANGAVITYAIDAYNAQQDATFTTMMKGMARLGGGKYFKASSDAELLANLTFIINEIQAVNSVFAAVSLPVSVNQRGTFLNQVYLGVFRPDALAKPNWPGNLKQYQIAVANPGTANATLFLADKNGVAATSASTGFISPGVTSFWSTSTNFWDLSYYPGSQSAGGTSDAPDGELVEKGGVAQGLRTTYATTQAARNIYTCSGSCTLNSLLSGTLFKTTNADTALNQTAFNSGGSDRDSIINWVRGANNMTDDNPSGTATTVRAMLHGDVLHSRPAIVNYSKTGDAVYVYYGANDGMLHAVKGGQTTANGDGVEQWAFIATEHVAGLKRLRDHTPIISTANRKPYFIDGSPTVYTNDVNGNGELVAADGDKAYLYLTMRRGGRFIYALDVSTPTAPRMLWKHSNLDSGFGELGQTWSEVVVGKIRASTDPVLIFGLGYDATTADSVVAGTATMGRGVMIVNAFTGAKIWSSADIISPARGGINASVAAGVSALDTDGDGKVDRLIAADLGGNIWRMNIDDASTSNWTVDKVASLGGSGANARRFLSTPDVVMHGPGGLATDTILIGSGDREQPFDATVSNRFYMIRDFIGKDARWTTPLTESSLYNATSNLIQDGTTAQKAQAGGDLAAASGWYIVLGTGEKVDGEATTLSGTTFFGTNTPADNTTDICISNLGTAKAYAISYINASATTNFNGTAGLDVGDRSQVIPGGGFPPPGVALQVVIDGQTYQAVAFGTNILPAPSGPFGRRYRSWWYEPIDP